jgi:outer membrane protein assembly factor BamB
MPSLSPSPEITRRQCLALSVTALSSLAATSPQQKLPGGETSPKLLWQRDLSSPSYGGGAIGDLNKDGNLVLVFGTYYNDEHLYAVQAKDGKLLWKFRSEGGPFDASVALVDLDGDGKLEVLAADSSTGMLFCLDGEGKVRWKTKLLNSTDSPPAVADIDGDGKLEIIVGTMMLGDRKGRVMAIDSGTQKPKWIASIPGHVQSEPVLIDLNGDGQLDVLVTTWRGDKAVHALRGKDGTALWRRSLKGDMYHGVTALALPEPRIVAASIAGDVMMLDGKGNPLWTKRLGGYLFGPTAAADLNGDGMQRRKRKE